MDRKDRTEGKGLRTEEGQKANGWKFFLSPPRFSTFDRVVGVVLLVAVGAILLTIALGDRVGVSLKRATPLVNAHSTSAITMQFDEPMDRPTVEARLRTDPPTSGTFAWTGALVSYQPATPMIAGNSYTVILERGARSESGRETVSEFRYSFTVMPPRIAYLYPADDFPQNIWAVDADDPASAQQLTFSPSGIYDFAVSPDGTQIAFAENNTNGTMDIKLLNLDTGGLLQLTNCIDATCSTPVWRPDGKMIAYERIDYNTGLEGVNSSPMRIWTLDMTSYPPPTRPLFSDLQILGYGAQWSADGNRIALVDRGTSSILVYDFTSGAIMAIPTTSGSYGALAPDGAQIITSSITLIEGEGGMARVKMQVVNLDANTVFPLSAPDDAFDDKRVQWMPDGARVIMSRDNPSLIAGTQLYAVNPLDGTYTMLTDDPNYASTFFYLNPSGTQLAVQRLPLAANGMSDPMSRPEIWVIDAATGEGIRLAQNGYLPRWIP